MPISRFPNGRKRHLFQLQAETNKFLITITDINQKRFLGFDKSF